MLSNAKKSKKCDGDQVLVIKKAKYSFDNDLQRRLSKIKMSKHYSEREN